MFFKRNFYFCSLICVLYFCLVAFLYFWWFFVLFCAFLCFLVRVKSFCKKKKEFKSALITSFILLLVITIHYIYIKILSSVWWNVFRDIIKPIAYGGTCRKSKWLCHQVPKSIIVKAGNQFNGHVSNFTHNKRKAKQK